MVQRLHRLNVVLEVLAKIQMEFQMRLSCYRLMCVPKRHDVENILIWMNNLLTAGNCFGWVIKHQLIKTWIPLKILDIL